MDRIRTLIGRRTDRGAAAVEMALVLPMLLFVVFGIIDFGRLLNAQITLTEAAREGARASALGQPIDPRVQAASGNLQGVTEVSPTVACPSNPTPDQDATVTTSYTFKFVTPVPGLAVFFGGSMAGTMTLTGKGVMPCMN